MGYTYLVLAVASIVITAVGLEQESYTSRR